MALVHENAIDALANEGLTIKEIPRGRIHQA
jgi:hypothetical protein